jgi:predicted short-subunit dehydrogenase-like oxidoreductase (DUF2520 family)
MTSPDTIKDTISIIGLGKVGTALGFLLRSAGYSIVAVADPSPAALEQGIAYTGGRPFYRAADAASLADCVFITTSDDAIMTACDEISLNGGIKFGTKVVHTSGAGDLGLLSSARRAGALLASIHPLQSFADVEGAIRNIPGSTFGITADDQLKEWAVGLVKDLGGIPFYVSEASKPLYHTAACMASNYLTTLLYTVEQIYQNLGLSRQEALRAFWPLVRGTLSNIEFQGTIQALTGPIARGDLGTIEKHIDALKTQMPFLLDLYRDFGMLSIEIALKKETLSADRAIAIKTLLGG